MDKKSSFSENDIDIMDNTGQIDLEDLFDLNDIQKLQDEFARATGVATIITRPDGVPITRPGNFTRLCNDIIRKSKKGCENCYKSDAVIGRLCIDGPVIQPCLSGGLWDAGAGITVGGKHIANWLIGQVRNEAQTEEKMRSYAREIGVDEEKVIAAFREVPSMTKERFANIAQMLFTIANQLSTLAYQNLQRARFIAERKKADQTLRRERERLQFIIDAARLGTWEWNFQTNETIFNETWAELIGYKLEDLAPHSYKTWEQLLHPEDLPKAKMLLALCAEGKMPDYECEFRMRHKDGHWVWILDRGRIMRRDNTGKPLLMFGTHTDITARKMAEEEQKNLQAQLYQAQKMESVGRLAGGVAHDFNNMLGAILGFSELAMLGLDKSQRLFTYMQEIRKAAERSAGLTRQLLAFARRQDVILKVLDLNVIVEGILKMLQRIIGEDIELAWLPCGVPAVVEVDPSQVDQILANLCVNARDAIGDTGKLTIETDVVNFDQEYCALHAGYVPGDYVLLAVSDNGHGMDSETLSHLFEPFFTTKAVGKGTGLGLATVYGIVKQNNGFINVYSEPGQGTTFKIYLPRHVSTALSVPGDKIVKSSPHGHETILLVEDEPMLLEITQNMLEHHGYHVLPAASPCEAIRLAQEYTEKINLLLTDVIMPEMNGRDLARNLLSIRPDLTCLFMSGYTANVIANHGVLDEGMFFIQKPFSSKDLAAKIREIFGSLNDSAGA
ncbi:MAG: PocR ligand-binding domain-containing protein [Candidatus Riflebacteria bacterium]|nr:PocR ligand-binding domain-containing protein [Candidatus Riflebacteria bacterium]